MNKKNIFMLAPAFLVMSALVGCKGNTTPTLGDIQASCNKTFTVGDEITKSDVKVTATYSDKSTKDVTDWTCDAFKDNKYTFVVGDVGSKEFTIKYSEKTTTLKVTVNAKSKEEGEVSEEEWNEALGSIINIETRNCVVTKKLKDSTTTYNIVKSDDSYVDSTKSDITNYETFKDGLNYRIASKGEVNDIVSIKDGEGSTVADVEVFAPFEEMMDENYKNYTFDKNSKSYKGNVSNSSISIEIKFNSNKKVETVNYSEGGQTCTYSISNYGSASVLVPTATNGCDLKFSEEDGYLVSDYFNKLGEHDYYCFACDISQYKFLDNRSISVDIYFYEDQYTFGMVDAIESFELFIDGEKITPFTSYGNSAVIYNSNSFKNHKNLVALLKLKSDVTFEKESTRVEFETYEFSSFIDSEGKVDAISVPSLESYCVSFPTTEAKQNVKVTINYDSKDTNGINLVMMSSAYTNETTTVNAIYSIDDKGVETKLTEDTDYKVYSQESCILLTNAYKNNLRIEFTFNNLDLMFISGTYLGEEI